MQKTLTVNGKRFTGKQIAKEFNATQMTHGEDYIIFLNGQKFFGNYRKHDGYYLPVCDVSESDCIALMSDNGTYTWDKWITLVQ